MAYMHEIMGSWLIGELHKNVLSEYETLKTEPSEIEVNPTCACTQVAEFTAEMLATQWSQSNSRHLNCMYLVYIPLISTTQNYGGKSK